jgi:ATP-dependent Clp protease protease subunit
MSADAKVTPGEAVVAHREHHEEEDWYNERLLKTRSVLLSGPVDNQLAQRVVQSLLILEADDTKKPIDLIINSPGGSVTAGFGIYDVMNYLRAPIRCIAAGITASIATIILLGTKKDNRLVLPNTRLLIHQPLIPMNIFGPTSDLEITANEIVKTRKRINALLATECGQPLEKVEKDTQRDYWLSAEEAVEYGLVSRVVNSRTDLG